VSGEVRLGEIVKAVGLRGEVKLRLGEDFWDAALDSAQLELDDGATRRPVRVEMWRPHGPGTCVLHLQGIDDRTAAEALVGRELVLQAGALDVEPPPAPLPFQLRGLRVELVDGALVGEIAAVLKMPAQDVMVVRGADREHLIPNVAPIVREVDWVAGVMRIDPPAGLLEL
jgi:16S rRNA processing protein RimM